MFHNLTKLRALILKNCRIFFLDGSLAKDLKALTGLVLTPKDNVDVLQNLVEHFTSLKNLHLLNLGLYCSCDNAWLVSWAKDNRKVQVAMFRPSMKELQCLTDNRNDHLNFLDYSKNCQYIAPFYHIASGWFREALREQMRGIHFCISACTCSLEMQLATDRLQVEHRYILILVFLEMIPSRLLSFHHRLALLGESNFSQKIQLANG
uniref:Uncharacterized protein n=1 Tax=Sinocyclocheilus rhinocerous TaxID=307959 RepID=A0A673IEF1_9TELE